MFAIGDRAGCQDAPASVAFFYQVAAIPGFLHTGLPARMCQLYPDLAALRTDEFDDPAQSFDMLVFPDAEIMRRYPAFRRDGSRLRKHQPGATYRARSQMDQMPVVGHSIVRGVLTHRADDDAIAEDDIADLKGAKQFAHISDEGPKFRYNFRDP